MVAVLKTVKISILLKKLRLLVMLIPLVKVLLLVKKEVVVALLLEPAETAGAIN